MQDAECAAAAVIVKMAYLGKGVLLHPGSLARCRGHQGPVVRDAECAAAAVIVKMAYLGILHAGSYTGNLDPASSWTLISTFISSAPVFWK